MVDFQLLSPNKYDEVRQLLRSDFPRTYKIYNLLKRNLPKQVYIKYKNGKIDTSVIAIKVLISNPPITCIYAPNSLLETLQRNPIFDWTCQSALLYDVTESELPLYEGLAKHHGGSFVVFVDDGLALEPSTTMKEMSIPENVLIRPMTDDDAELIYSKWEYRRRIPFDNFQLLVRDGGGFILIEKESNQPISWVLMNDYGGIGCLNTLEEHRGKGYGSLMAAHLSQHMINEGMVPFCHIGLNNVASRKLFEKLGFRQFIRNYWLTYSPPTTTEK